tara:strand:- start:167 stop:349 length:183 start_codon:yes stop_codon:yes gene_type:complete
MVLYLLFIHKKDRFSGGLHTSRFLSLILEQGRQNIDITSGRTKIIGYSNIAFDRCRSTWV